MDEAQVGYIQIKLREILEQLKEVELKIAPLEKQLIHADVKLSQFNQLAERLANVENFKSQMFAESKVACEKAIGVLSEVFVKKMDEKTRENFASHLGQFEIELEQVDKLYFKMDIRTMVLFSILRDMYPKESEWNHAVIASKKRLRRYAKRINWKKEMIEDMEKAIDSMLFNVKE